MHIKSKKYLKNRLNEFVSVSDLDFSELKDNLLPIIKGVDTYCWSYIKRRERNSSSVVSISLKTDSEVQRLFDAVKETNSVWKFYKYVPSPELEECFAYFDIQRPTDFKQLLEDPECRDIIENEANVKFIFNSDRKNDLHLLAKERRKFRREQEKVNDIYSYFNYTWDEEEALAAVTNKKHVWVVRTNEYPNLPALFFYPKNPINSKDEEELISKYSHKLATAYKYELRDPSVNAYWLARPCRYPWFKEHPMPDGSELIIKINESRNKLTNVNTRRHMLNEELELRNKLTGEFIIKKILYKVHDTSMYGLPLMIWSNQYNKLVNALIKRLDNYDVSYLLLDGKNINSNSFDKSSNNKWMFREYSGENIVLIHNFEYIDPKLINILITTIFNNIKNFVTVMFSNKSSYGTLLDTSFIGHMENVEYAGDIKESTNRNINNNMNNINKDRNTLKGLVESYGKKDVLNFVRHLNESFDEYDFLDYDDCYEIFNGPDADLVEELFEKYNFDISIIANIPELLSILKRRYPDFKIINNSHKWAVVLWNPEEGVLSPSWVDNEDYIDLVGLLPYDDEHTTIQEARRCWNMNKQAYIDTLP